MQVRRTCKTCHASRDGGGVAACAREACAPCHGQPAPARVADYAGRPNAFRPPRATPGLTLRAPGVERELIARGSERGLADRLVLLGPATRHADPAQQLAVAL